GLWRLILSAKTRCATPLWPHSRMVHRPKRKIGAYYFQTDSVKARQMSTPPPGRTPAQRDPLKLLSAILTGLVLGFFAVLFAQRLLPRQEQDQTLAHTDLASRQPMDKPRAAAIPAAKP